MYTLTSGASILRSDGATIPADPANTDYATYLAWVAAGNTPAPALSLVQAQVQQVAAISAGCQAAIFAGFSSNALGATYHYPAQLLDQQNLSTDSNAAIAATQNAVPWVAGTVAPVGALVAANGQIYINMTQGTTGPNAPAWPSVIGVPALDGGAQWTIWTIAFWCRDADGNWANQPHTASQIRQANLDFVAQRAKYQAQNSALAAQVASATSVAAVQEIVWTP